MPARWPRPWSRSGISRSTFLSKPGSSPACSTGARCPPCRAVDGVNFEIRRGEVFGLAGESGSGKSTVGRLVLNLLQPTTGQRPLRRRRPVDAFPRTDAAARARRMQIIFQDPLASLNPRMTIGQTIAHPSEIHQPDLAPDERRRRVRVRNTGRRRHVSARQLRRQVPPSDLRRPAPAGSHRPCPDHPARPDRRRRAHRHGRCLGAIVAPRPDDEAQGRVRSHLSLHHPRPGHRQVRVRSDRHHVSGQRSSRSGPWPSVYQSALHPYTEALLEAVPVPDPRHRRTQPMPTGEIPSAINPPPGCSFHPRCPLAVEGVCDVELPLLEPDPDEGDPRHLAACHVRTGKLVAS